MKELFQIKLPKSMTSRRRIRVHVKHMKQEFERLVPGCYFHKFEVSFSKHKARLHIQPDGPAMDSILQLDLNSTSNDKE